MALWQFYLGAKKARYLLMSGRLIDGKTAAEWGLASINVPKEKLEEEVDKLASEIAAIPPDGALHNKIAMNTDFKMRGIDALFDYYGQMNRYGRMFEYPGSLGKFTASPLRKPKK
jgi:enoyl-CoA hydratase/carnithine racemase